MRLLCLTLAVAALVGCQSGETETAVPHPELEQAEATVSSKAVEPDTEAVAGTDTAEAVADIAKRPAACSAKEETLFSCTVSNGKQISVCAQDKGKVEYRYGRGDAELVLSDPKWASVPYSGGGEVQIAFDNGDTRYIVFSRVVRTNFEPDEPNYPAISDGVIVQRGKKVLNIQACGGKGELKPIDVFATERIVAQRMDDLFTYETERADPF